MVVRNKSMMRYSFPDCGAYSWTLMFHSGLVLHSITDVVWYMALNKTGCKFLHQPRPNIRCLTDIIAAERFLGSTRIHLTPCHPFSPLLNHTLKTQTKELRYTYNRVYQRAGTHHKLVYVLVSTWFAHLTPAIKKLVVTVTGSSDIQKCHVFAGFLMVLSLDCQFYWWFSLTISGLQHFKVSLGS